MSYVRMCISLVLVFLLSFSIQGNEPVDTIYHGGPIVTIDDQQPIAEAIAIKAGKIVVVGNKVDVLKRRGDQTKMVNLQGKTLLPGFVDSHGHAYLIGLQATTANLLPPPDGRGKDIPTLVMLLRDWAKNHPTVVTKVRWIVGFGYDDSQLTEQRHPTRSELDDVSRELPVLIIHQSGHLGVANSKALALAGITAKTPDPKGGVFRRQPGSNEPNGVCEEYAFFQVAGALASRFDNSINDALVEEGAKLLASFGYTTGQEGRAFGPAVEAFQRVAKRNKLPIDVVAYPDILEVEDIRPSRAYQNRFRVGGAKLTIDGSPQGKTAWLSQPYLIPPPGMPKAYRGYAAIDEATTKAAVNKAFTNGWQLLCHANGDAASDRFIAAVREAKVLRPDADLRPVLIHGQVLRKDQIGPLKELGIFPSLFPMHTYYWGDWHRESVLGPERADNISPTGWLLEQGMRFGSHHDAPVALPDSIRVLSATVTRRSRTGDILGPQHRVPVATALKAMTLWPAWQHFEEKSKGSLEVGKLADLVILSDNPLTVAPEQLDDLKVLETIKEGVTIYKRPDQASILSSPALFGVSRNPDCRQPSWFSTHLVCGDGCFNRGLTVLLQAIQAGQQVSQGVPLRRLSVEDPLHR